MTEMVQLVMVHFCNKTYKDHNRIGAEMNQICLYDRTLLYFQVGYVSYIYRNLGLPILLELIGDRADIFYLEAALQMKAVI